MAIPAFARKYGSSCETCHRGYPDLNGYGIKFKENGFQMAGMEDGSAKEKSTPEKGLALEKSVYPISIRILGDINSKPQSENSGQDEKGRFQITFPEKIPLYAAGTIYKNISFWMNYTTNQNEFEEAYVGFHNIMGEIIGHGAINFRIGFLNIKDWTNTPKKRLLHKKPSIYTISAVNPEWTLEKAERGIELYGRPGDNVPLFYYLGISNGVKELSDDTNPAKNYYGGIAFDFMQQHIGVWSYTGRNSQPGTIFENNLSRVGIDWHFRFLNLDLFGEYIQGYDRNPAFLRSDNLKRQRGYYVGFKYCFFPDIYLLLNYDYVRVDEDALSKASVFTPGLAFYIVGNFRGVIEYQLDLLDKDIDHPLKKDRFNLRLDMVF